MSQPSSSPNNKKQLIQHYNKLMWMGYAALLGFIVLFFMGVSWGLLGAMPTFTELESPKSALASEVYGIDGTLIGKFFVEDRTNTNFEELPKTMVDALTCTEDVRFYE
ncbi:MAG: hypothetical protein KA783_12870, partial [Chitinophagales bacterium]|nr:hypothetical protein [Chitinophagales bacterium]